ncbi:MAG: adenosine deaminase [Romboutsia sp.]|uniref:adenosine deaminase n=1 Tax=Romboutsia sp. TaxID=1965302 RepID=UPI003F3CCDA3
MTKNLPKIELHCHLDGSVRSNTIIDIAKNEKMEIPTFDEKEIKKFVQVSSDCKSLNEYLKRFDLANKIMQSKDSLERVTFELLEDAASENVKYIEVRFAPQLHTQNGLEFKEIIQSAISGIKKAENMYDIKGNLILSCMRTMSVESGLLVIEEGQEFLNKGVVAIDLAGPEEEGFVMKFKPIIDKAKEYGYRVTIHAGEACSGQNVIDAINILGAERIGHGVRIRDMKDAYELVKEKSIILEMCPTSNIQTKAIDDFKTYPLVDFYKDDINVTLNTDNRTVSNIDLSNEIDLILSNFDVSNDDYKKIYLKSVDATFADEDTKKWLRNFI